MDAWNRGLLRRLPLAEAVLLVFAHLTEDTFLAALFQRHRGRCYQKVLSFAVLVRLLANALLEHAGSAKQSFARAAEGGRMPVTDSAAYRKLGRLPLRLSQAFLAEATDRLRPLMPPRADDPRPARLRRFAVVILDGKKIKHVAKRLKPLRGLPGAVLGGKVLAALTAQDGLVVAFHADPDGEVNDCPLVPGVLRQVRARLAGPRLFLADRQFCGLTELRRLAEDHDHFLVRRTTTAHFTPDPQRPGRAAADGQGRPTQEQWGWLGTGRNRRYVRQIGLERPGAETVTLVTDLLDDTTDPAEDLLAMYLGRWQIERVFQQVTEVFALAHLIGSTPEATVFQCAFCMLLYNLIQVVRATVAATHQRAVGTVSAEQVFYDARRSLVALTTLGDLPQVAEAFDRARPPEAVQVQLARLLEAVWSDRWLKAPAKTKPPPRSPAKRSGAHTSVFRALKASRHTKGQPQTAPNEPPK